MKSPLTAPRASRVSRFATLISLLALLSAALPAAFAAPALSLLGGGTGQALSLLSAMRRPHASVASHQASAAVPGESPSGYLNAPNGRAITDRRYMRPGAIRKNAVTGANGSVVPIPGAVQTFDVFNPPPAFRPLVGFGSATNAPTSVNNDPTNPPIYLPALTVTNLTPVWSQDQTFIVFSSNRDLLGNVTDRFHLWAISVNGGEAFQITTSTGPLGGGEFFPALTSNDGHIAFTSDAQSPGVQNLYDIPFSFSALAGQNNAPASISDITAGGFTSVTMQGNDTAGAPLTGFDQVQRPTVAPSNDNLIVFSAHSVTGTNRGHYHIFYLNLNTGGFDPNNNSLPGKISDGPADDTDPAYSKDGQFIAFASTAQAASPPNGGFVNQGNGNNAFSSNPNTSQILSSVVNSNGLRNLYLVSGGGGQAVAASGFGTVPASLQSTGGLITTAANTDNFGPAWSSVTFNQYTNAPPGFEYLAFARGPSPTAPHDIYYLQTVRNIDAGGESSRSDEAGTTPEPINTPVYQTDAGGQSFGPPPTGPGTNQQRVGNYQTDTGYTLNNLGTNLTIAAGGASGPGVGSPFNQTNDQGTPSGIYNTSRTGAFSEIFPNLTPGANYTVRFHLADPTSTTVGTRVFPIIVNGQNVLVTGANGQQTNNIDIVQQAQQANGTLVGLVVDGTGAPIAGATISVTGANGAVTTTPTPVTTTATTTSPAPPNGDGQPINYTASLPSSAANGGTFTVTVTPPAGSTSLPQTQTVSINSANFTRANFTLNAGSTTLTGTVTDATTTAGVGPAQVTVTDPTNNAVVASTTTAAGSGAYTVTVPAGTYNVTAAPPPSTGEATQTAANVTFTAGTPAVQNFTLASGIASVGSLVGTVTNTAGTPISGVTVTVIGAGYRAIVQTSGQLSTQPTPNGDGAPANYDLILPGSVAGITYTVTYSLPGFIQGPGINVTVKNDAATRQNVTLTPTSTAGQNTAVVINTTTQATTQTQSVNTGTGPQAVKAGAIIIQFPGANSIVQGIEILADTSAATSSGFGGFTASTTNATGPQGLTAIGGDGQVTLSFQAPLSGLPPDSFNIYRSAVTAASVTSVNQPGAGAGTEGNVPFFIGVPFVPGQNPTQFVDTNVTNGTEYFYQVTAVSTEKITPEGFAINTANGTVPNAVIRLNTDDSAGETGQTGTTGNSFDDVYPTWSPFLSIFNIAYQSGGYKTAGGPVNVGPGTINNGRTVTYNDPATNFPVEVAASVPDNGTTSGTANSGGYSVGPNYTGILQSQVLNLDPPTLLRFSNTEIVHVQPVGTGPNPDPVNGVPTKIGINPGQQVTFTVRLSDREAGIDNGNDSAQFPTGPHTNAAKPQVFLQIKDPDSKYQDAQKLEHKLFASNPNYNFQANHPLNDVTSGTNNDLLSIDDQIVGGLRDEYPTYGFAGQYVPGVGAHAGFYSQNGNDPTPSTIFVGKSGGGTNQTPILGGGGAQGFIPGADPNLFKAWGPEYECQFLNPDFSTGGGQNAPGDASPSDYGSPYYLAGVDDFAAFSGLDQTTGLGRERPTMNYTDQGATRPAEWLQMTISPVQDHLGGVLYTVTWTTPASGSDFYLDVIAFDKAVFPNFPPGTSSYSGGKVNWRIYDNVGGFSTNASVGNNDILVVSDYALGQKFAATTFGGTNGNLNLLPKLYGAESYFTDVDINVLPDSVYAGFPIVPGANAPYRPFIKPFFVVRWLNGLGVGSYDDGIIDDGGSTDGVPFVQSQKYSLWRILARGPVPQSVLNSYLPTTQAQPAVNDSQDTTGRFKSIPAKTILDAHRCVIWLSPYTGSLLTDPGALDDPGSFNIPNQPDRQSTQTILRNFVQGGGRLFLTGQNVASSLTLGGNVGNAAGGFLSDVMNATLVPGSVGSLALAATGNRVTGYPEYDGFGGGFYPAVAGAIGAGDTPLGDNTFFIASPTLPFQCRLELSGSGGGDPNFVSDAGMSQRIGPNVPSGASLLGKPDVIAPANGAVTAMTYAGGGAAMVYHVDDYDATKTGTLPGGGTGGRTVFASFGLEGMSQDAFSSDGANPDTSVPLNLYVPAVAPRNPRPNILHNVVCFLRTGGVSGVITQTAGTGQGAGQGVPAVTVYLIPRSGAGPTSRATFSAMTASDGHFSIVGVEPGTYTIAAYRAGFARAVANSNVSFTVEGDVTLNESLTITPLPPGSIAGQVKDTTGAIVVGATVSFLSKDKTISKSTQSFDGKTAGQAAGNYFLPNVPVTDYTGSAVGPNNPNGLAEYTAAAAPDPPFDQDVTVQPNTTTQPVNFTLTPILATISGRIYNTATGDSAAGALANATVTLTNAAGTVIATAKTAADGTYTFTNVPATQSQQFPNGTTYTISATLAGFAPNSAPPVTVFLGDVITSPAGDVGLTPIQPGSITGTVTDGATPTPNPIPGATVTAVSADGTVKTAPVTTAANGTYTIPNVPPATYTVTAVGPLNPHGRPTSTATAPQTVTVTAGAAAGPVNFVLTLIPPSFSGIVSDGTNPLVGATVTVTDDNSGQVIETIKTGSDGSYKTGPLPVSGNPATATYTIKASLVGYTSGFVIGTDPDDQGSTKIIVYNGDVFASTAATPLTSSPNVVLTKIAPGSITGIVTDTATPTPNPVAGATVTFVSSDGTVTVKATTDPSGNYVIPASGLRNVPAGSYTGSAVGPTNKNGQPEYQPSATVPVTISPNTTSTVNFTLAPIPATVSGTVTDSTIGKPIPGATVTFTPTTDGKTASGPALTFTTDLNGTYSTGSIPPGTYLVTAGAPGYFTSSAVTLLVELGDNLTQPFSLDEQATLAGLVTDASTGATLAGVSITISNAAGLAVATIPAAVVTTPTTTAGPDGQPINYSAALKPGAYSVTASKGNYNSQTQKITVVQGFNRLNFTASTALLSAIGTLGGLVTDSSGTTPVGGATVTITDSSGNVVATVPTTGGSTTGPDGGQINYSVQVPQGTGYTVTVTKGNRTPTFQNKITVTGGAFRRVDFTGALGIPPLHTFAAGLNFLSTPYDYSAVGFDAVFGNLNTAPSGTPPNGNRSHVAVWNPLVNAYALDPTPPADAFRLGVGYWIYLRNPVSLTQQGALPTTATVPVTLHPAWNQIGVPSTTGIPVSSLKFDNGTGGTITFAQAVGNQYHLVSPTLYRFDGAGYQPVTATDTLQPWTAYWIKVFTDATIEIPTSATSTGTGTGTGVPGIPAVRGKR